MLDDINVKISKQTLLDLIEYFESKDMSDTSSYLEGLLLESESYNDIVEKAENFDFLDQYHVVEEHEGQVWWDLDGLPPVEISKGWLGFQEYVTLLRTQGDEKIVH